MTTAVVIVLAVVVVVIALVAVVVLVRKQTGAAGIDEQLLRRVVEQSLRHVGPQATGAMAVGSAAERDSVADGATDGNAAAGQPNGLRAAAGQPTRAAAGVAPVVGPSADQPTEPRAAAGHGTELTAVAAAQRVGIDRSAPAIGEDPAALASPAAHQPSPTTAERPVRERTADERAADQRAADERAAQRLAAERAELQKERAELAAARAAVAREAAAAVAAERAELQNAQQRLHDSMDALAQDQRHLTADRQRLRSESDAVGALQAATRGREEELKVQARALQARSAELAEAEAAVRERAAEIDAELARVAALTPEQARAELLAAQETKVRRESALLARRIEAEATAGATRRARAIVADAIQKVASDQTAQTVVSMVSLPAEEVKGRIIGREGRNIRTFENVTGVNVIIDDTPEAVLLSCFDPVRREIGRVTLETLIEDGRIHPHRIEEAYERAHDEVRARCARAAEDALLEVGLSDLHPELVTLVGQLKYRTSYGQNVLGHLIETAHIARGMADELGIDPSVVVRGAFLHDIGKALTHEAQGSHALVGAQLARRYGESDDVAHCIEAHHDEVAPATVEAVLTQAADACSGGRPGARRESLELYVERLERIESIASAKRGVEKVFAMQAGRELRVMVKPELVDDLEAHVLAREVAKQIEEELTYPGQVRVTVIRESRATEVAR